MRFCFRLVNFSFPCPSLTVFPKFITFLLHSSRPLSLSYPYCYQNHHKHSAHLFSTVDLFRSSWDNPMLCGWQDIKMKLLTNPSGTSNKFLLSPSGRCEYNCGLTKMAVHDALILPKWNTKVFCLSVIAHSYIAWAKKTLRAAVLEDLLSLTVAAPAPAALAPWHNINEEHRLAMQVTSGTFQFNITLSMLVDILFTHNAFDADVAQLAIQRSHLYNFKNKNVFCALEAYCSILIHAISIPYHLRTHTASYQTKRFVKKKVTLSGPVSLLLSLLP